MENNLEILISNEYGIEEWLKVLVADFEKGVFTYLDHDKTVYTTEKSDIEGIRLSQ
jgi:hypothetical protein